MFRLASAVVAIGLLAACAGATSTPSASFPATDRPSGAPVAATPRMDASGCGKSRVYVTSYNNSVYVYNQTRHLKTPCGQITGVTNPQGLFVDKHHNLWVAISGNCKTQYSSVLEFGPKSSTPIKTLQDSAGSAADVAIDNASGTVYVTNFFDYTNGCASGNNGVVEVYAHGSTTPTGTLSDPNMTYAFNDAVDNQGNLYVTYLNVSGPSGSGRIDEWIGGSGSPVDLGISLMLWRRPFYKHRAHLVCARILDRGENFKAFQGIQPVRPFGGLFHLILRNRGTMTATPSLSAEAIHQSGAGQASQTVGHHHGRPSSVRPPGY